MELFLPAADEQSIQRQLHELDPCLILTRERDAHGRDYYVVIYYQGGTIPPDVVADWREPNDQPKQLSSGLVFEIQKKMKDGPANMREVLRKNAALREKKEQSMEGYYEEMIEEYQRGDRSPVHRSQGLRMARDRMRSRGIKA